MIIWGSNIAVRLGSSHAIELDNSYKWPAGQERPHKPDNKWSVTVSYLNSQHVMSVTGIRGFHLQKLFITSPNKKNLPPSGACLLTRELARLGAGASRRGRRRTEIY